MGNVMKHADSNENPTVLLRRMHRWRMAFFGLAILLAGVTIGAAGAILVVRPTGGPRLLPIEMMVRGLLTKFREELRITDEQAEQIRAVLEARMKNLQKLREEARPKIEEQLKAMKAEVNEVLTEEQQKRWQEMLKHVEREFHRGMRRGPGMPGGPGGPGGPPDGFRGGRDRSRRPGWPGEPRGERGPRGRDRNDVPLAPPPGEPNGPEQPAPDDL